MATIGTTGTAVVDVETFRKHVAGEDYKHKASSIVLNPTVSINSISQNNVQSAIEALALGGGGGGGASDGYFTTNTLQWYPTGLMPSQDVIVGSAITDGVISQNINFNWTPISLYNYEGLFKITAEIIAKDGYSQACSTFDVSAVFFKNESGITTVEASAYDHATRGTPATTWNASILWTDSSGTGRPRIVVEGASGALVYWGAFLYVTKMQTTTITPPFTYSDLIFSLDLHGANKTASQINSEPSNGTSSGKTFIPSNEGQSIIAGASLSGKATYANDAIDLWSFPQYVLSDLITNNEFTLICYLQVNTYEALGTLFYDVPAIFKTGGGGEYFGIGAYNDGAANKIIAGIFDGAFKNVEITAPQGTPFVVAFRLKTDGTLGIRTNSNSVWVELSGVGPVSLLTNYLVNYSANGRAICDIQRLSVSPLALTDVQVQNSIDFLLG